MLLRKLVAAFVPLLLCAAVCAAFRLVDARLGSTAFVSYVLKGVLMGAAIALTLPAAGVRAYTNGLTGWLLLGAGVLAAVLVYQGLEASGAVHVPFLRSLLGANGQVVLAESTAAGYMAIASLLCRDR